MLRSQKHPVVLEKRYPKVLSQWGCHAATEMSRVVTHLGVQLAGSRLLRSLGDGHTRAATILTCHTLHYTVTRVLA